MTVDDALRLPILRSGKVLTDRETLADRTISGVSVIEVPVEQFIRPREFVLSTGLKVGRNVEALSSFVRTVAESRASALGLAIGPHTTRIPKQVVHIGNQTNLTIIELPWKLRFSEISEAILKSLLQNQIETQSKYDFVWALANRDVEKDEALRRANKRGYDLRKPYVALAAKIKMNGDCRREDIEEHGRMVERCCHAMAERSSLQWLGAVAGDRLIGYLEFRKSNKEIFSFLNGVPLVARRGCELSWGIGSRGCGYHDFADSYKDARAACEIGICGKGEGFITDVSDVLADRAILRIGSGPSARPLLQRYISPLAQTQRVPLSSTLETLVEKGFNVSETARALGINRQSLLYRLEKIQSLLCADLTSPEVRFAVALSLRLYRLQPVIGAMSAE